MCWTDRAGGETEDLKERECVEETKRNTKTRAGESIEMFRHKWGKRMKNRD